MAPADPATPLLAAALAAFLVGLVGPVAINVASRSPALVPSVARGYGCRVGAEVRLGDGILGIAALERTPIRIGHAVHEYRYSQAARRRYADSAGEATLETEIPLPGLPDAGSQMAVPLVAGERLLGVLYGESPLEQRFSYEDEDALTVLAAQLALAIELINQASDRPAEPAAPAAMPAPAGRPVLIRHFPVEPSDLSCLPRTSPLATRSCPLYLQMKVQIIERDGQPEWAVLPYAEYLTLLDRLEDIEDQRAFDQARAELAAGDEELVPADVVARLSAGESPLKVWREHRGLTQQALADAAGVGKSYLSQLDAGARTGSIRVLRALAQALDLDLDDLTPWRQD